MLPAPSLHATRPYVLAEHDGTRERALIGRAQLRKCLDGMPFRCSTHRSTNSGQLWEHVGMLSDTLSRSVVESRSTMF